MIVLTHDKTNIKFSVCIRNSGRDAKKGIKKKKTIVV